MTLENLSEICCPEFNPKLLDGKTHVWKDKLFIKGEVKTFLHIPLNMDSVMTRLMAKIDDEAAHPADKDFLMLFSDNSLWKSEVYLTVTKNIPGATMAKLSGTFLSKSYDGPYSDMPKWIKDISTYIALKGSSLKKLYFHYPYCPKCAKKYGHNYAVAFAQVS